MSDKDNKTTERKEAEVTKTEIDDETNSFNVDGTMFTLPKRYEVIEALGSGAYGSVVSAYDLKKGMDHKVAIK